MIRGTAQIHACPNAASMAPSTDSTTPNQTMPPGLLVAEPNNQFSERRSTDIAFCCVTTIRNRMWSDADVIKPPNTTSEEPYDSWRLSESIPISMKTGPNVAQEGKNDLNERMCMLFTGWLSRRTGLRPQKCGQILPHFCGVALTCQLRFVKRRNELRRIDG